VLLVLPSLFQTGKKNHLAPYTGLS